MPPFHSICNNRLGVHVVGGGFKYVWNFHLQSGGKYLANGLNPSTSFVLSFLLAMLHYHQHLLIKLVLYYRFVLMYELKKL